MPITLTLVVSILIVIVCIVLNYRSHKLVNWSENVSGEFNTVYYPKKEDELISIMQKLPQKTPIIICGVNHSWSPSKFLWGTNTTSTPTQLCLSLIHFKGNISYDESTSVVTCLSGTPLGELLYFLAKRKRILATYPNSPFITVGGMIATCSHGASLKAGSVSDLVTDLTCILPGDNQCKRVPNSLLGAYASSMGQLGVVCEVSLNTIPISWLKQTTTNVNRKTCVKEINTTVNNCELLKIFWNLKTDMCEIQEFVRLPNTTNDAISLYSCKIDNHFMVYQAQDLSEGIHYAPELDTQFGVSKTPLSLKNTTGFGHCQKQFECPQTIPLILDAEFVVSIDNLEEALTVIKSWITQYSPKLTMDTIYLRFTGGDSLPWISPVKGYGIYAWIIVSMEYTHMPDHVSIFSILENELWNKTQARPHMGKWNTLNEKRLIEMYGNDGINFLELAKKV